MREKAVDNAPAGPDLTTELFDQFVQAGTFRNILTTFRELCDHLELKPATDRNFYHHLKSKVTSWKAKHIWTKLDKRATRKEYKKGKACANTRVLVIGAGPCGLRTAIECSLLGAKTVIIEKRDSFSRNNVLHLWPFLINDLRNLGAKKFFGKFCAGAIDHISIRQLQCILTKVALILGVEIHNCVTYEGLEEPPEDQQDGIGWRAKISPKDHPVYEYEFDVLVGADGSRNAVTGFKRKEFRGKLAIAITANFINKHSQAEAMVEEISGVAFIFNQKFFQDLKKETGIDLENIVYYKDDTHYFVMTAKKQSLLAKGVILQDHNDVERLLSHKNVSQEKLQAYARGAAKFSTNNQLPHLDFAINHYGQSDVAMFDFTSLFQAEYAARVLDRNGHRLLLALVGDSLLEPFWPTGSGCARGFLGSFDAAWMIRSWAAGVMNPLEVLAERESIYRLLAQTTPENLAKDYDRFGLTPTTRYPHVVTTTVKPHEVLHLYDTKDADLKKRFELGSRPPTTVQQQLSRQTSVVRSSKLLFWCQRVTDTYTNVNIQNFTTSWKNGLALCAIIHRYRPDLIDFDSLQPQHVAKNNQLAFDIAEKEFGIPPAMTGIDMSNLAVPDRLTMTYYVSRFYDLFKDELPPVLRTQDENEESTDPSLAVRSPVPKASFLSRLTSKMRSKKTTQLEKSENKENLAEIKEEKIEKEKEKKTSHWSHIMSSKKHRSKDIIDIDMDHRKSKLMDRQEKVVGLSYQKKFDEKDELDVGVRGANRVSGLAQQLQANLENSWGTGTGSTGKSTSYTQEKPIKSKPFEPKIPVTTSGQCFFCNRRVYVMERLSAEGLFFHRECFRCQHCNCMLRLGNYSFASGEPGKPGRFFCRPHYYLWGNNPATQHLAKKRPISTDANQMPPVPIITQRPPSIVSIPEDKPISPTSPSTLPDKDLLLTEPLNKKYRATPERIELENMRENIAAGNVEMSEEELAKYNLGNYSTESDDSDDSDSEEIVTTRRKKSRKLHSDDEDEEYEEDDDDEDEEYDEEDEEEFESFSEDEIDSDDELLISSTEEDTSCGEEEEEKEKEEEKHTPINHIRNLSSLKAQWLSQTAAPHIKSPEELEAERKEKEEKERIERERKEQKQREKEERRRLRQEKRDSIRREKERRELEKLEKARREQEEAEEELRKQEEWERKMAEKDRLDEEERQKKLQEADIVDKLGVNGIGFADSDMEKEELEAEEGTPAALKKIDTPGPSKWRDAFALRFASYEDEDGLPMMTPVDQMESLTDDEKVSLRKESLEKIDKESKQSPKRKLSPTKKISLSDMDDDDNEAKSQESESISIDDNKLMDSLRLEEDEGLPDEKTASPKRKIIPYGESSNKSFLAIDDEDYDDLGEESPMELEVGENVDEIRKDGDGESEHLSEGQDGVLPKEDSRARNTSATDSFTISTPTGSVTSLSSLNVGSLPSTMDFEAGKEEVVDIDTPVIEAYNPPGVITPSFKGELANPSEKESNGELRNSRKVLHLDTDLDVVSGYDSKFAESIDEPERTISPKYKDSNLTDVKEKLSSAESSTHSTPVKVNGSIDLKSSKSDAKSVGSSAEDSSPKHGNRNFNNAAVLKNVTDDNTGSESAGDFVMAMDSIQPSQIKTDTLKHKKKRTSSGSGTARVRSDKVREQKASPKSSPKLSRTKKRLPRTPSGLDPELTAAMKKRGEYLLKVKAETPPKDEDRPRSESEPMSGSPTKDSANVSTVVDDSRTRSQSETTESFHTPPTSNVGSPTAAEKSPNSDTQMQFSSGVPKSESKSKEKKSRLSLMRRDKKDKDIKRRNAVRSSVVPDDVDIMAAGKKEPKKLFMKRSKKKTKRKEESASHDELDTPGAVGGVDEAVCLLEDDNVFPEPDILEGLQSKLIPAEKIIKPAVRKLSIDPLLTGDLDESSTEDEAHEVVETPPTTKPKKGKSPRRIWGKKFKEKRKLEEEELNEKLTRRVQKEARKQHRQQQQKRLRMAQEIQRQLQECEVKQRQLEEKGIDVEKSLRGEKKGAESVDENSLMQQWFGLVNEKNALVRFESELMVQARELELEDRHSALEQELRHRMAVEDEKKTEADREAEKLLLEEIVEVVEQRDALVALLEEERLKEQKEDHDIESIMLRKGLLTAMKP